MKIRYIHFVRFFICLLFCSTTLKIQAHEVPPSVLTLDIGATSIHVSIELPLSELSQALTLPLTKTSEEFIRNNETQIRNYTLSHLKFNAPDGNSFSSAVQAIHSKRTANAEWATNEWVEVEFNVFPPTGYNSEIFKITNQLIIDRVLSHRSLIYVRHDIRNQLMGDTPVQIGLTSFGDSHINVDGSDGSWGRGFLKLIKMGMEHISSGADHLLFLLTLLIPVSLVYRNGRWQESKLPKQSIRAVVGVVTGFTLGHSITLALASSGVVPVAEKAVEVLIAVSILISSVHAYKPLFPGREVWVATGFGLIHGLAFAETLFGMSFDTTTLVVSVLGFNLGIELMQLLVICTLLPIMLWLNASKYCLVFRLFSAIFAGLCAAAWIAERSFGFNNPLQVVVDWLAPPPNWFVGVMAVLGCGALIALTWKRKSADRLNVSFLHNEQFKGT